MEKKTLITFMILSIVALFVGDRFGDLVSSKRDLVAGIGHACDQIGYAIMCDPFRLSFEKGALVSALVFALAVWVVWAAFFALPRNYRSGEEQGSAKWGSAAKAKKFKNEKSRDDNLIFTENFGLATKRPSFSLPYDRNFNVLVIGGSGAGKTRYYVKPNIAQLNANFFITDPKGTVLAEIGHLLEEEGYQILSINTVDFSRSLCCNPLQYVNTDAEILSFVKCFIANTKGDAEHSGDPFWEDSETLLYVALIAFMRDWLPKSDYTLLNLYFLMGLANASEEDENAKSSLDYIFEQLKTGKRYVSKAEIARSYDEAARAIRDADPEQRYVPSDLVHNKTGKRPADHGGISPEEDLSLRYYTAFKKAAGKTLKSILISCEVRLAPIALDEMSRILGGAPDESGKPTGRCELELDKLGDAGQKRAIFAIIDDTDRTFSWLTAVLMWQTVNVLCKKASVEYGGKLPEYVHFIFDEFANIGKLPDIEKTVAVTRSRGIGISFIVQSVSQLDSVYGQDVAKIIKDNCDTTLFLGGKSVDTNKEISDAIGQMTITQRNFSQSKGQSPSYTHNYNSQGRALMDPAEVGKICRTDAILLISGTDPLRDRKYPLERHPRYDRIDPGHPGCKYSEPFDYLAYVQRLRDARMKHEAMKKGKGLPSPEREWKEGRRAA